MPNVEKVLRYGRYKPNTDRGDDKLVASGTQGRV